MSKEWPEFVNFDEAVNEVAKTRHPIAHWFGRALAHVIVAMMSVVASLATVAIVVAFACIVYRVARFVAGVLLP